MINKIEQVIQQIVQADYTASKRITEVGEGVVRTITELVAEAPDGLEIRLVEQIDQAPGSNECVREISARVMRGWNVVGYCACKVGEDVGFDTFPAELRQVVERKISLAPIMMFDLQARMDELDAKNEYRNNKYRVVEDLMRGHQARVLAV